MSLLPDPHRLHAGASPRGTLSLVGAGPGAADLLTRRALDRIARADLVLHDRLIDPEVLALIPPAARRIDVGKAVGANAWPQARIDALILAEVLAGARVVRLKSGDPSIFGRAAEEIAAAQAAGIPVDIVPGITAASAAAASLLQPLTERGRFDRLVLATATDAAGGLTARLTASLVPGTQLVLYMAMQHLAEVEQALLAHGLPADTPITLVARCGTAQEARLATPLPGLARAARHAGLRNPAVIFVPVPKAGAALWPQPPARQEMHA